MSDRAFLGPADTYLENRQIVFAEDYEKLERELAEAREKGMAWALAAQRCGLYRADVPHSTPEEWQSAQSSAACVMLDQLTAHKAALEKCETALNRIIEFCEDTPERALMRPSWIRDATDSIAKLKGTK